MMTFVAPCAIGAEKILSNELKQLGFKPAGSAVGRVAFTRGGENAVDGGSQPPENPLEDLAAAYRANLRLRTADRVYLRLASFPARDFEALFEGVRSVSWEDWFPRNVRVIVDKVRTRGSKLSSEHSIQGVTHKAVYERLGSVWKMRTLPETGSAATVRVYVENDEASVLLDLSGMPLHRRGYRTAGGEAPIRETLATVLLQLASWRRKTPLHDAFCGSGTIPIEATLYAHNIAPGLGRAFALSDLAPFTSSEALALLRRERLAAASEIRTDCLVRVTGSDIDSKALAAARANAERACSIAGQALQEIGNGARIPRPDFTQASFADLAAPYPEGLLLSNPPWGERLGDIDSALDLYRSMGELWRSFPGWDFGFITSQEGFEDALGRSASKKKPLKSGNLDTKFYLYNRESGRH